MRAKSSKKISHLVEFAGLRFAIAVMHILPLDWATGLMGYCWEKVAPRTKRHPRALAHLAAAFPHHTPAENDAIARRMWNNLGHVAAETVLLDKLGADPHRINVIDRDVFDRVQKSGKAAVYVTLHAGNWETAGLCARAVGSGIAGVYQPLSNPYSERYLAALRRPFYAHGLFRKAHNTGPKLMSLLKSGGSVAFVADVRDRRGVDIEFFGKAATATHIPALMARVFDLPLIAVYAKRTKGSNFDVYAQELQQVRTNDKRADATATTQRIHNCFEAWIRKDPAQWMWILKKWR
ncbi:lysophospholipid acyltransferase family protein [Polycladidibacter hongkongensis]|uniref:lysophospholipid acyltransferase family protein n=1 Tax=Polycladidibacter hongkongensis TaxID=1647556 RepID=UPI00083521BA|nr:hypothetical protein [Pseudovibrio hongkongensis]